MITPNDITLHLQNYLPAFTDIFSEQITATATASGNTVTVTSTAHGHSVGNTITVGGGTFENAIAAVVDNGDGTLSFETTDDHDLTEPKAKNDPTTLTLDGIGAPWDGTHTIFLIPNRKTFEIEFPDGETVPPVITSAVLVENRAAGIVGLQTVATVPDVNTFTFVTTNIPTLPTGGIQDLSISTGLRVTGAESIERAEEYYTGQGANKAFLFVIMNDGFASKDRHTLNDAVATYTSQNYGRQTIIQAFSLVVFYPTDNDAAGATAQNLFYGDILRALTSTVLGFFFPDPDTRQIYRTVFEDHGGGAFRKAYAYHGYNWQIPTVISFENGFLLEPDVAFRDIVSTWLNNSSEGAPMELNVDLDTEPVN